MILLVAEVLKTVVATKTGLEGLEFEKYRSPNILGVLLVGS